METRTIFDDTVFTKILVSLCFCRSDAKPFLWRMFFGWRQSRAEKTGCNSYTFIFSAKEWKEIESYVPDIIKAMKEF